MAWLLSDSDDDSSGGGRRDHAGDIFNMLFGGGGGGGRRGRYYSDDDSEGGGRRGGGRKRKAERPHLPPLPMAQVEKLHLKELKELCRTRYLPVTGTKPALIARLTGGEEPAKTVSYHGPDPVEKMREFFGVQANLNDYSGPDPPSPMGGDGPADPECLPDDLVTKALAEAGDEFRKSVSSVPFHADHREAVRPPVVKVKMPAGATTDLVFPLSQEQEALLKKVCKPAPFGRGEETVFDAAVRNTLQLDPAEFSLLGNDFNALLAPGGKIITMLKDVLAPASAQVTASLYKLLYYPPGSFFTSHVDTQRSADMFATLTVELQTPTRGGDLLITHEGKSVRISPNMAHTGVRFTAFFADCLHEVAEITAGCRVALVYNLTRSGKAPAAPKADNPALKALKKVWEEVEEEENSCEYIGYLLAHQYAVTSAMPAALKGSDAVLYDLLKTSVEYELLVAPITISEKGTGGCGDERVSEAKYLRNECNWGEEGGWRETHLIDPRKAPKDKTYVRLHSDRLESLVPLLWINPDPSGLARLLSQDVRPSGNEGTGFALSYVHFALFIKEKGNAPQAPPPAAAAAAAAIPAVAKAAAAAPTPAVAKPAPAVAPVVAPPAAVAPLSGAPAAEAKRKADAVAALVPAAAKAPAAKRKKAAAKKV